MSLEHKAFAFDWMSFERELLPVIYSSLDSCDSRSLLLFVQEHRNSLSDPYEGNPLAEDWLTRLENGDVQELADHALTRYFDPSDDQGLGLAWSVVTDRLALEAQAALLGNTIGPANELFDPGRMGSYFQTPKQVSESVQILKETCNPD